MVREGKEDTTTSAQEEARLFLDNAARARVTTENAQTKSLKQARDEGTVASTTTDQDIGNYASAVGYHSAATSILNNPPSRRVSRFLEESVDAAQHSKGPTWTEKYGDLRGSTAAKQRAKNTGLTNEESLHPLGITTGTSAASTAPAPAAAGSKQPTSSNY